jgi:two-component system LytT family response regulator
VPERALRAVVVDDEAPARALLREYLAADPAIEIVAECTNGFEAVKRIGELSPDVVFLDVQMPKLDGFEVVELLAPGPVVVFCTAYDEYALRAFEVHAVDYLLKPFGRERLAEAIARVRARLGGDAGAAGGAGLGAGPGAGAAAARRGSAALAQSARAPGRYAERLIVRDGAEVHVIAVPDIERIEAQDDYVEIHAGGQSWLKQQSLAEIEQSLDPARFVRVHRSHLVPLDRIARIEPWGKDSRIAILKSGSEVPVSRGGYQRLRERMAL